MARDGSGEAWQLRIDLTVEDAEDLAEQLRALIAAAKMRCQGRSGSLPAAIALPELQIEPDPGPALRLSDAKIAGRPQGRVIRTAIPA